MTPFPGPNSTITSAFEKSTLFNIFFTKNLELGIMVPEVFKFLIATLKKAYRFSNGVYLDSSIIFRLIDVCFMKTNLNKKNGERPLF